MKKLLLMVFVTLNLTACGFEIVDTGNRGVQTRFGEVVSESLPEGLHFYNPFTSNIVELEVREQVFGLKTIAYTKDTQSAEFTLSVNFNVDPTKAHLIYRELGMDFLEKTINTKAASLMKDIIGQYTADDIISKREEARKRVLSQLQEELLKSYINVLSVNFDNIDFDDAYEQAIQAKVVAIQKAAEARNQTVQKEEEAKQQVITAKAEAEAMRIKTQALSQNKALVQYELVQKWDGKLPGFVMGGNTMPMLNVNELMKSDNK